MMVRLSLSELFPVLLTLRSGREWHGDCPSEGQRLSKHCWSVGSLRTHRVTIVSTHLFCYRTRYHDASPILSCAAAVLCPGRLGGDEGAVTAEPTYDRVESSAPASETKAARCESRRHVSSTHRTQSLIQRFSILSFLTLCLFLLTPDALRAVVAVLGDRGRHSRFIRDLITSRNRGILASQLSRGGLCW